MPNNRFGRKAHKEPLYRRENTRTHGVHHGEGAYRHQRNSKAETASDAAIHRSVFKRRGGDNDLEQPNIPEDHQKV